MLDLLSPAVLSMQGENAVKKDNEASSWWMENYVYCCSCVHDDLISSIGSALGYSGYVESAAALLVLMAYLSVYGSERRRLHISLKQIKNIALGQSEEGQNEQKTDDLEDNRSTQADAFVRLGAKGGNIKGAEDKEEVVRPSGRNVRGPRGPSGIAGDSDGAADLPGFVSEPY